MNVVEEAVAEELLPYKELFTSVIPGPQINNWYFFKNEIEIL